MAIAILVGRDEADTHRHQWFIKDWKNTLLALDPSLDIRIWPSIGDYKEIDYALVWKHPLGLLTQFPHLKAISSLGAGVDHLLADNALPKNVPIVRVVDPYMANDIVQYITAYVLNYIKRVDHWAAKQRERVWSKEPPFTYADKTIGIMGLGFLGSKAAHILQQMGLNVIAWSNSPKNIPSVKHFVGQSEFNAFLAESGILICMLPLTHLTKNILSRETFSHLPIDAYVINVGRGEHLVAEDLIEALDSGRLSGACLDVFSEEPLPSNHPLWTHPHIRVTPHIASVTNPKTAAPQIVENYHRAVQGKELLNLVDLSKGY